MNLRTVFWDAIDIGAIYEQHSWAIDGLIYLVLFVGLTTATLGRHFEGRGGRAISIASGLALTVAAITASRTGGFALAELGGVAWALLLLVIGLLVYDLVRRVVASRLIAFGATLLLLSLIGSTVGSPIKPLLELLGLAVGLIILGVIGIALLALAALLHRSALPVRLRHMQRNAPQVGNTPTSPSQSDVDTGQTQQQEAPALDDTNIAELLEQLDGLLARGSPDSRTDHLLHRIAQRRRAVDDRYANVLRALARAGWRSDPGKRRLAHDVKAMLKATRRNSVRFREALRIAEAGHDAGNVALVREAVGRLLALERESETLASDLNALFTRLDGAGVSPRAG